MSTWKYTQNGQQLGPVDTSVLLTMLKNGTVTPETSVCKEGAANWVPIRAVPELSIPTGAGVPPLSSTAAPLNDGEAPDPADVDKNKIFAILAYLGILFLVPLLAAKDSRFARYHTNQGVVLFIAAVACSIGGMILSFIPFVGCLVMPAVFIAILVFVVLGIMSAAQGVCKPLPVIGQYKLIK
jgi:uncharacterized membrane protein